MIDFVFLCFFVIFFCLFFVSGCPSRQQIIVIVIVIKIAVSDSIQYFHIQLFDEFEMFEFSGFPFLLLIYLRWVENNPQCQKILNSVDIKTLMRASSHVSLYTT